MPLSCGKLPECLAWFYGLHFVKPNMTLRIGQRVRLRATGEVGVVAYLWTDEYGDLDTYVSFFGKEFPIGEPAEKPYVLRYYASSLDSAE